MRHAAFDRTFSTFPRVNRVTWNIRHRCLLRTNDAPRSATPQNCPRCFFPRTEFVRVDHSPGHPLAFAPTDWSFYRIRDPAVGPGRYSFETAGAPSARYCVDVYVEYANGRVFHSAFTTRLLTAAVHTDTEFLVTQEGGTPRILRQFTAEETPANCAWS